MSKAESLSPFHLAFPVTDIAETRSFYTQVLGCTIGRESERWIDFNFYGHQISAHLAPEACHNALTNPVDEKNVPVRHFGVVLPWDEWGILAKRLQELDVDFLIEPYLRFKGEVGEQATLFLLDPSKNGLEFKAFKDQKSLFATD